MTSEPVNLHTEIEKLETELNAVVALSSVSQTQRDSLRERLRLLKEKAGPIRRRAGDGAPAPQRG